MKRIIFLSFLVLTVFGAEAQIAIDKAERLLLDKKDSIGIPSHKGFVNLSGDFYINSNSITNKFMKALLYQGKFIDESMKDHESRRLKKGNRLGGDGSLYLNGAIKTKKLTYVFGVGQRVFGGAHFQADLFELALRGNASYAGKEADLSRTNVRYFDYQSLYFGAQKDLKDGKYTIGAALSLIRGGNYQSLQMKDAKMYTEPSGQYVELNGDIKFSRYPYDTSGSFFKSHGKGAGLNLYFSMQHHKNRLNVEVRDLGFIQWNNIKTYSGDGTFRYNGVLIDNLLGQGSSIVNTITMDSIAQATGLTVETKNRTMLLPTVFHVNYVMMPNKRFTRTVGMRYMLAPGYLPEIYLRSADFLGKGFVLVNTISYGGYGRFDYELGLMKKFKNSFIISANLFAFEYLVLPGKSSGHGLNIGLTKLF